ncbi:hypothetical protein MBLNU230_g0280t1 [Neophaeotheca triangularis]
MTTRRTKVEFPPPPSTPSNGTPKPTLSAKDLETPPPSGSPWLPTPAEFILLAIYPGTLLLGSIFSVINATNRNSPYQAHSQSHDPSQAPSYFAKKSNIFNLYFVKIGWFWTTLAFLLFVFSHSSLGRPLHPTLTKRRVQALARYAAITVVWIAVTQWFFGPPIVDRGFRWTGGQCEIIYSQDPDSEMQREQMGDAREALTHAACKVIGGRWKGGHDISGHVFLLILGSAMLWLESLPAVLRMEGLREARRILMSDGLTRSAAVESDERAGDVEVPKELGVGVKAALGVAGLSWWMLLMTAAYFHTWFEKLTGLLVAFATLYLVYFLPRAVPGLRRILGMPGV